MMKVHMKNSTRVVAHLIWNSPRQQSLVNKDLLYDKVVGSPMNRTSNIVSNSYPQSNEHNIQLTQVGQPSQCRWQGSSQVVLGQIESPQQRKFPHGRGNGSRKASVHHVEIQEIGQFTNQGWNRRGEIGVLYMQRVQLWEEIQGGRDAPRQQRVHQL
jgi:hypothetical protein